MSTCLDKSYHKLFEVKPMGQWLQSVWHSWWATASVWDAFKFWVPTALSLFTAYYVFHDRKAHLDLVAKKGEWCILKRFADNSISFEGVIEVYNASSRPNAIRNYEFAYHHSGEEWIPMESEHYFHGEKKNEDDDPHTVAEFNVTPISLAPYSAQALNVQAIAARRAPHDLLVLIVIEDLFGKKYSLKVKAAMD